MRKLPVWTALIGLAFTALAGATHLNPACAAPTLPERTVTAMPENEAPAPAIPPLDAAAPPRTETATFALG
jgi:hypothetical protein